MTTKKNVLLSYISTYTTTEDISTNMSTVGHYQENDDDYEAITRIFDSHSLLQCPLCKKDFQDPRILCSNGHTFCLHCLQVRMPLEKSLSRTSLSL